jgi:small subunit ribosomal protein S13
MVSIFRKNLKNTELLRQGLTRIEGVGTWRANLICDSLGLNPKLRVKDLGRSQLDSILYRLQNHFYTGPELKKIVSRDVNKLIHRGCYRGVRHRRRLPVRGQRTHTNSKSARKFLRIFR